MFASDFRNLFQLRSIASKLRILSRFAGGRKYAHITTPYLKQAYNAFEPLFKDNIDVAGINALADFGVGLLQNQLRP